MAKYSASEIKDLVSQFTDKSLPKDRWSHEAHLIVGLWHHAHHPFEVAVQLVKKGIIAYNGQVGTANTATSRYHETLTIFWMLVTHNYLEEHCTTLVDACNSFLTSVFAEKEYPLEYYTRPVLFSRAARQNWINGDIRRIEQAQHDHTSHRALADDQFIAQFLDCTMSPSTFTHEAHLRLAWNFIKRHGANDAIVKVQNSIQTFVRSLGATDKYHQTLTIAGVQIVAHFMQRAHALTFDDFMLEFPQLKTNFKDLVESHYSFDIFSSVDARLKYFEPDIQAFS